MAYAKLEVWKVTERREGLVYKTKKVGAQWFPLNAQPECYKPNEQDEMYVTTLDYHWGPEKPKD